MALKGGDFSDLMMQDNHQLQGNVDVSKTPFPLQAQDKNTLYRLYSLSKPEHRLLYISAVTLAVTSGVQLCIPASTGLIIDAALEAATNTTAGATHSISTLLGGLFSIMAVAAYLTYIRVVWQARAGHSFTARLRKQVYASLLSQDAAYFDVTPKGDILSRLASDTQQVKLALTDSSLSFLRSSIMTAGAASLLLYTCWSLALVALTVLPPTILLSRRLGKIMKAQHSKSAQLQGDATSCAEQALTCIKTVQQFCAQSLEAQRYFDAVTLLHDTGMVTSKSQALFSALIQMFGNGSMLLVLAYGGNLVATGALTAGSLAGFVMYSLLMAGNVGHVSGSYVNIMKSVAALDRLLDVMDREPSISPPRELKLESNGELSLPSFTPIKKSTATTVRPLSVEFSHVSFSYPARPDVMVLKDFSIFMPAGRVLAVAGSSGGGKSTVAALLTRLYNAQSGTILVDGVSVSDLSPNEVRESIGIVQQEPLLFPTSIADNIRYGRQDATQEELVEAARLAHVLDFCRDLPMGLDTIVGALGTQLSGGQRQRVAIARCLIKNPAIMIFDESTSALDSESEHQVQLAMETACRGRTVLVIAHRLSTIKGADKIAVMKDGRVIEEGTFEQLTSTPNGVFRQLVERQL